MITEMVSAHWPTWKSILNKRRRRRTPVVSGVLFCLAPFGVAYGHAFGQRFDLPIPLDLYLAGAAGAVFFSFVLVALFARAPIQGHTLYPRYNLLRWRWARRLIDHRVAGLIRVLGVGLFLLTVAAGLAGIQDPQYNLLPTMLWIIWWTGMAYFCALVGNLWALINPLNTLFSWAEALYRRLGNESRDLSLNLPYPARLGVWPACALFWIFVWGELIWTANAIPLNLAVAVLGYSLLTWAGMFLFGRQTWLRHGEAFSLAFGLLARFAPMELRVTGVAPEHREWNLRPFGAGLLAGNPVSVSRMVFVMLMLSTVTFDGLMGTPLWAGILEAIPDWRPLQPLLFNMEMSGVSREVVISTTGLVLFPLLFAGLYLSCMGLMKRSAAFSAHGRNPSTLEIGAFFVYSLVPIALAYHLAHYFSFLLTVGQLVIPLASDPFGLGWNLLGTADYQVNIAIVGARFVWYTSVVTIVLGHIIAVYVAHVLALRALGNRKAALISQAPMLVLMILYTVLSLWILAQPLIE